MTKCVVECPVSYFVAAAAAAAEDIVGERDSDEQNCRRGTSYGLLGLWKRSSARMNGGVPTGCYVGFPCGSPELQRQIYLRLFVRGVRK